jgi:hypothetical protein
MTPATSWRPEMTQTSIDLDRQKQLLSANAVGMLLATVYVSLEVLWLGLLGWLAWSFIDWLF